MKRTFKTMQILAMGMLMGAAACSTQMQNDNAQDSTRIDSTMIHPMNPDSDAITDTVTMTSSRADTMKVDTGVAERPM